MKLLLQIIFSVVVSPVLLTIIVFIIAMFKISSECSHDEERKELEESFKAHKNKD